MNEFWTFIADQKTEKYITFKKYEKQTLCTFCQMKNEKREVKDVLIFLCKTFVKKKKWRTDLQLLRIFNEAFSGTSAKGV